MERNKCPVYLINLLFPLVVCISNPEQLPAGNQRTKWLWSDWMFTDGGRFSLTHKAKYFTNL